MSFNQFVLYLKDIGVRLVDGLQRAEVQEIYKAQLERNNRETWTCEDFIETIRKYKFLKSQELPEKCMQDREAELAFHIKSQLLDKGDPVPIEV